MDCWIEDPAHRDVMRVRSTFVQRVKGRFEAAGLAPSPVAKRELSGETTVARSDADERS